MPCDRRNNQKEGPGLNCNLRNISIIYLYSIWKPIFVVKDDALCPRA